MIFQSVASKQQIMKTLWCQLHLLFVWGLEQTNTVEYFPPRSVEHVGPLYLLCTPESFCIRFFSLQLIINPSSCKSRTVSQVDRFQDLHREKILRSLANKIKQKFLCPDGLFFRWHLQNFFLNVQPSWTSLFLRAAFQGIVLIVWARPKSAFWKSRVEVLSTVLRTSPSIANSIMLGSLCPRRPLTTSPTSSSLFVNSRFSGASPLECSLTCLCLSILLIPSQLVFWFSYLNNRSPHNFIYSSIMVCS